MHTFLEVGGRSVGRVCVNDGKLKNLLWQRLSDENSVRNFYSAQLWLKFTILNKANSFKQRTITYFKGE
jgi:hypothetical protein